MRPSAPGILWQALRAECAPARGADLDVLWGLPLSRRAADAAQRAFAARLASAGRPQGDPHPEVGRLPARVAPLVRASGADLQPVASAGAALDLLARAIPTSRIATMAGDRAGLAGLFARYGHEVIPLHARPDGSVAAADLAAALECGPSILVTSTVLPESGHRPDLPALAAVCRTRGARLIVDGSPSFGLLDLHLDTFAPDAVVVAVAGGGGLLVRSAGFAAGCPASLPSPPDEAGDAALLAFGGALDVLEEVGGPAAIEARVHELTDHLLAQLDAASLPVRSPRAAAQRANVTIVGVPDAAATAARLAAAGIRVGACARGVRVALHAFTLEAELDACVDALVRLGRGEPLPDMPAPAGPLVCVDLNGVLDEYRGWQGPQHWDPPREGAQAFLAALRADGCRITVFTTRYYRDAWGWLRQHGLAPLVDEVTDRKPPADVFVDDRAIRFAGDFAATLDAVRRFTPHWQAAEDRERPPGGG